MLVDNSRQKLINAINFFARDTRYCFKTKLFKLLYFLDFEHFKLTGRPVTGLEYFAWPKGPVPKALQDEISHPEADMLSSVSITQKPSNTGTMVQIRPVSAFDDSLFSKREIDLMQSLAKQYRDAKADDMIEETHLENLPWHKIYNVEGKRQQLIPYELAIRSQEEEEMREVVKESRDMRAHYR
jgi:uncharacterized phage-associated protein